MAKKKSFSPFVLLSGLSDGGDVTVIGGGTGQSTTDVFPCSYEDWLTLFAVDYDNNGFDFEDYRRWFGETFGDEAEDLWSIYNDGPFAPGDSGNSVVDPASMVEPETVDPVAEMLEPEI